MPPTAGPYFIARAVLHLRSPMLLSLCVFLCMIAIPLVLPSELLGQSDDEAWGKQRIVIRSILEQEPDEGNQRVVKSGITRNDFQALISNKFARQAVGVRRQPSRARYLDNEAQVSVLGTSTPGIVEAALATLSSGRNLSERDLISAESVCLIDQEVATRLFGDTNPLGRNLKMEADVFTVVGIVDFAQQEDSAPVVIIPLKTMRARWGDQVVRRAAGSFSVQRYELSEIWIPGPPTARKLQLTNNLLQSTHESDTDYVIEIIEK